ncbi:MAG: hypothetical protein K2K02_08545 [Ruminococcus sp.]|nr:hypothetical protein [Ruminococcus sp.]MDE6679075.1 hypothetical protein [Ruminococcus sp.]
MFEKKEKRFIVKESHGLGMGAVQIIVDTVTGVNYLNTVGGASQGLTPLLDENGNIVIDKTEE